jgi:hypothetical protein
LVAGLSGAAGQPRRTLRQEVLGEWWMMMGWLWINSWVYYGIIYGIIMVYYGNIWWLWYIIYHDLVWNPAYIEKNIFDQGGWLWSTISPRPLWFELKKIPHQFA